MFVSSLLVFVCLNIIIWKLYVDKVNSRGEYVVGDLASMSYYMDLTLPRKNILDLKKKHISFSEFNNTKVDMLVVGDSYSNGGGNGRNNYYQDYIATYNDLKVLNILQLPETNNFIETVILLANSGYLKKLDVKYVFIQSVQREALERFATDINYDLNSSEDIYKMITSVYDIYNPKDEDKQEIEIMNNLNQNALLYNVKFMLKGYGKFKGYFIEKINKELFSSKISDEVIFFTDDIKKLKYENDENIMEINDNFNKLAKFLREQDIKLLVMINADKYNVYSQYISSHKYPKSTFFEILRKLPKRYQFIDTKEILLKELEKGVKDLYYPDDTHWSYKASEAVFKNIKLNE